MTENDNYLDPNSGAASQPGGFAAPPPAVEQDDEPTDVGADTASLAGQAPAGNARREDWVDYARGAGASEDELKAPEEGGLTRDQLRDQYGA